MLNLKLVLSGLVFLVMGFSLVAAANADFYLEIDSDKDGVVDNGPINSGKEFNILVKVNIDQHFPISNVIFDLMSSGTTKINFLSAVSGPIFTSSTSQYKNLDSSWHYGASAAANKFGTGLLLTTIKAIALPAGDLTLSFDSNTLSAKKGLIPVTVNSVPKTLTILAPAAVCSIHSLGSCNEAECKNLPGYWYGDRCYLNPECDAVTRLGCTNEKECVDGVCVLPEPTCSPERLNLCLTGPECKSATGYWYKDLCNKNPECNPITRLGCSAGKECVNGVCVLLVDTDGDDVPDAKDNCPLVKSTYQTDTDKDGMGDVCDLDDDNDDVLDTVDNCPFDSNLNQADQNGNGFGNACDADVDGDGTYNAEDSDIDGDGVPNNQDTDDDGDGIDDNIDPKPSGIGTLDDLDDDGILNGDDNCPGMNNKDQTDSNDNGIGDACEGGVQPPLGGADGDVDGITDENGYDQCPASNSFLTEYYPNAIFTVSIFTGCLKGDLNKDDKVDGSDINFFIIDYRKSAQGEQFLSLGDINEDGKVDGSDINGFIIMYRQFGKLAKS